MESASARHHGRVRRPAPEWEDYAAVTKPFEWKWCYAFQQVGDQRAESLSRAYGEGRAARDRAAQLAAALSPPAVTERLLERLAQMDVAASLR